ncbi:MAG: adenylate/guanylate cyclase domain-containing protein [Leptonema sp. (in: Bacteria)]|nr:adenylate/guanylate cyclase domain-containing protein [Leptonema sp. (in: bacteria)]
MKNLSLRTKLTLLVVAITTLLSITLSIYNYLRLKEELFSNIKDELKTITYFSTETIDKNSLLQLNTELSSANQDSLVQSKIEQSDSFQKVVQQLNFIRDSHPTLIRFVYTFSVDKESNRVFFLVDAEATTDNLIEEKQNSADSDISHFATEFDITDFPIIQETIKTNQLHIEPDFEYDSDFDIYSISGYAPIFNSDQKTVIGYIGIDVSSSNAQTILNTSLQRSFLITILIICLSIFISLYTSRLLTKALQALDMVVQQLSLGNFEVRANVTTHDEVGRLGFGLNQMAEMIIRAQDHNQKMLNASNRFVPQSYIKLLGKRSILDLQLGDYVEKQMTVLFSDIRGFTTLSEKLNPEQNFKFINSFLNKMGPIIRQYEGIIDKYIGDAIMALFSDQADNAVTAAVEMHNNLLDFNMSRLDGDLQAIKIGIGIHRGDIAVGTIGEKERIDATVIGDTVNFASRLEGLTKIYGANILISKPVLSDLKDLSKYKIRFIDRVIVKGKTKPVPIYEVLDGQYSKTTELKIQYSNEFQIAARDFHKRRPEAKEQFEFLLTKNPTDKAIQIYLERCHQRFQGMNVEGVDFALNRKS